MQGPPFHQIKVSLTLLHFTSTNVKIYLAGTTFQFCFTVVSNTHVDIVISSHPTLEEVIHIFSFEPISKRLKSKSFREPCVESVKTDVIGTF